MQQLGVGREADRLGLHGGVHRHPRQVLAAQRAGLMRDPQALGQQQLQLRPSRLRQWLRLERSCGQACWKNFARLVLEIEAGLKSRYDLKT
jgi:hypothetical protein